MRSELPVRERKKKTGRSTGADPVVGSLAMAIGYTVVMGWILKYTVGAFTGATLAPADVDEFVLCSVRWHLRLAIQAGRL